MCTHGNEPSYDECSTYLPAVWWNNRTHSVRFSIWADGLDVADRILELLHAGMISRNVNQLSRIGRGGKTTSVRRNTRTG